jgi:hypothetical protein
MQAVERINSACPSRAPTITAERLQAIQDRISAMHDALLTIRLPFERFYASLSGDQDWRLVREADKPEADLHATDLRETTGTVASAQDRKEDRSQMCTEQAAQIAGWPMQAIGRAVRPDERQRAEFEALRQRLAGIGQLVVSSCPTYPLLGPADRLAAVADRLNVMLFALTTMTPALPDFYDSLSDKQKASLSRVIRQFSRRPMQVSDRRP